MVSVTTFYILQRGKTAKEFIMKKFSLIMLAILLAFTLAFVSCDDGTNNGNTPGGNTPGGNNPGNGGQTSTNPFKGTWSGISNDMGGALATVVFEDTTYEITSDRGHGARGTYTYSGNTATLTTTAWRQPGYNWETLLDNYPIYTAVVSVNTITVNGETFTKR